MTHAEIGAAILAAYDAGQDWPDIPLWTGALDADTQVGVHRHGDREGVGRARVIRGTRYWDVAFSWALMRDQPATTVATFAWYANQGERA